VTADVIDLAARRHPSAGPADEDPPISVVLPATLRLEVHSLAPSATTGELCVLAATDDNRVLLQWRLPEGAIAPLPGQWLTLTVDHTR
jgi:hypothetical protein